ncbi:MAG TPA: hypothetical protein VNF68_05710 [Candidatus Baltobacteraceae bacterium]|nr:hypothetical protein [Candidatus Baltobacteraceae bacterium]
MQGTLAFVLIVALVCSVGEIADLQTRRATVQAAEMRRITAQIPAAEAWMESTLRVAQQSAGTTMANPFGTGTTLSGTTVKASLVGQTGSGTYVANNLDTDPNAGERRVAVDVSLTGTHGVAITQRFFVRLTDGAPFVQVLAEQRLGGDLTSSTSVAADTGGCNASTGTGCDPLRTKTQDSSLYTGFYNCANGVGSGTCAPGQTFVHPTYGNASLTNGQATQGALP